VVLDTETAKAAEALGDELTKLNRAKDGVVTKITTGMLPALSSLSRSFTVASVNGDGLKTVGRGIGLIMNGLIGVFVGISGAVFAAGLNFVAFAKTMERVIHLDFAGAAQAWAAGTARARASIAGTVAQIGELLKSVEGGSDVVPELAGNTEDLADSTTRAGRATRGLTEAQREAAAVTRELAQEAAQVFEQTRTPAEQYATEVERLNRLLSAAAISQDTFNRAMRDAGARRDANDPLLIADRRIMEEREEAAANAREEAIRLAAQNEEDLRASTYNGIRDGLEAAADGNLGQYLASRLRSAIFDGLANQLTDLLRGPKGGNGGAFGWLNAAGSVLKSFAGGLPGFKTGGSFKVGGSGGADSQLMQFRATPGEMVDIRKPGQDAGGGMVVHVNPSPYFDVQVERVAAPMAVQAAATAYGATRSDMATAQRRSRQRFV
jgi:hypothetical protein